MRHPLATHVLTLTLAALTAACAGDADPESDAAGEAAATADVVADTAPVTVADAGLSTPESVLHDAEADVYLVSNINGAPLDKDGNGFISRVGPDGAVADLKWIDGATEGVTLNAPKGMALHGDTLFVADIDSVRAFGRTTGEYFGARGVPGATFLNDLTVGPDGTLYVSDSGLNADFSSSGTDAVHRFRGDASEVVAEGTGMGSPNGILAFDGSLAVVGFGAPEVRILSLGGASDEADAAAGQGPGRVIATLPGGQLDGIVRLDDGSFLVSSWETQTIYHVPAEGGEAMVVVESVPSPADIGWDARRGRVLIPVFQEDRLELIPVDTEHAGAQ